VSIPARVCLTSPRRSVLQRLMPIHQHVGFARWRLADQTTCVLAYSQPFALMCFSTHYACLPTHLTRVHLTYSRYQSPISQWLFDCYRIGSIPASTFPRNCHFCSVVTACDLGKSFSFNNTVEITSHVYAFRFMHKHIVVNVGYISRVMAVLKIPSGRPILP